MAGEEEEEDDVPLVVVVVAGVESEEEVLVVDLLLLLVRPGGARGRESGRDHAFVWDLVVDVGRLMFNVIVIVECY